ncbi:hypothetical protein LTR62_005840 [Meristemomyces frigidus]|uniref:L-dopachrome isomerase n=1 Tax=Meristemomyces frigidus TaxID=1508187 RepID=A0AAN7TDN8_9PEZI|nr:hypothetical protein LTR62_005840 [Meristemomyces frigidus]
MTTTVLTQQKRDSRADLPSANAWKRASLTVNEPYGDLFSKSAIEEIMAAAAKPTRDRTSMGQYEASKVKSQTMDGQFRYKDGGEPGNSSRERMQKASPVIAELRSNVIIKDEFTLVTDLSYHLAQRYLKPDSSIMIKVDHSACLALGGTFDPCYILTITTLPSEMGPTLNKRNASLIQAFMADILSVSPDRGIIKFQPIEEANYAMNGTTMLGQVEKLDRNQDEVDSGTARRASRKSVSSPYSRSQTTKSDSEMKPPSVTKLGALTNGTTPIETKQRSNSVTPPTGTSSPMVFELSGTDTERPTTSHGESYTAANGLRMNGISNEDLSASRPFGERPKTIAGQSPHGSSRDVSRANPMPKPQRQSSYQAQSKRSSMILEETKKPNIPTSARPKSEHRPSTGSVLKSDISSPRPIPTSSLTPKATYLDNVPPTTTTTTGRPATATSIINTNNKIDPKIDARAAEKNREADHNKDTAANTAKRRSVVTATPRMPAPPPIPEDKKVSSARVGKRKSFLSAFRRN